MADGCDEDVGLARDGRQVLRVTVADRDSRILAEQEMEHRLADDVAAADDDGALTVNRDAGELEHAQTAERRAGHESRLSRHEAADVDGMEAVDVLLWADALEDLRLVRGNLLGQRQLHEDAMDLHIGVERIDLRDELVFCRRLGHLNDFGVDAERLARLVLVAHVDLRGRIRADDDDGKARLHAVLLL